MSRSAKTGRFAANQRAAARAYIAIASKRNQPIPEKVVRMAGGTRDTGSGRGTKRSASGGAASSSS